ncbi:MAG: GNAT family N-acetyltransferase [Proteobacteria bacterium]|nr:GNAT family N-acetyltransferase [Pseudomonadota bacterium]
MLGPTIETARLLLRPPSQDDFDGFIAMGSEADTMRFIGGVKPPDAVWRQMATLAGSWALLGFSMFSVIEKASGEWIGRLGPWQPGGERGNWPGTEVGWGLRKSAMGKGYAQEGAIAAIDWAFDTLGWDNVIHSIDKENAPSIALALRLGSRLQREDVAMPAPFEGQFVDIYGQSRAEWKAHKR